MGASTIQCYPSACSLTRLPLQQLRSDLWPYSSTTQLPKATLKTQEIPGVFLPCKKEICRRFALWLNLKARTERRCTSLDLCRVWTEQLSGSCRTVRRRGLGSCICSMLALRLLDFRGGGFLCKVLSGGSAPLCSIKIITGGKHWEGKRNIVRLPVGLGRRGR